MESYRRVRPISADWLVTAALCALAGCAPLPSLEGRRDSTAVLDTAHTRLGRAIAPMAGAHPGQSGIYPLASGRDAFAARVLLADAAERALDAQYYIWHADMSGRLLFEALHRAAERGVRVRLLLDDNSTSGLDAILTSLDAHPNIEVRLFNPFPFRRCRLCGYLFDFERLNRRMHNKSFTADNQATIVGGRNIGDEYFDTGSGALYVDLDILAVGSVVSDTSRDFDAYWASDSSYPIESLIGRPRSGSVFADAESGGAPDSGMNGYESPRELSSAARDYSRAVGESPFVRDMLAGRLPFEWAETQVVSDDPAKGLGLAGDDDLLWERLKQAIGAPLRELKLVSAYFVPTAGGTEHFVALARKGVKLAMLTNSLEATDVVVVHAGYAKRRKRMLEAGISLFEMKRTSTPSDATDHVWSGSSASALHAKTFTIDGACVFVGSFNFDPRSARLNTEIGFVIHSPALAETIDLAIARELPTRAYEVRLSDAGELRWVEHVGETEIVHEQEPGAGFWRRLAVAVVSVLPVEWLL